MNENEHCIKAIVINGKCFRENVPVFLFFKVGYVLIEKKYLNFLFQKQEIMVKVYLIHRGSA